MPEARVPMFFVAVAAWIKKGIFTLLPLWQISLNDARLVQEEQFGPALPVIEYNDVDQALQWANANESGLGGSVWASDSAEAEAMAAQLESGVAWVNCHARIDPHTPFGGWKMSGVGLEFGLEGLLQFTNQQLVYKTK